jgi:hypothetical protein
MNTQHHERPVLTCGNPSPFLREQIREDSNYEMDWLWAAEQVSATEETRYCLERALYINPDNRETQRALRKLSSSRTTLSEEQRSEQSSQVRPSNR